LKWGKLESIQGMEFIQFRKGEREMKKEEIEREMEREKKEAIERKRKEEFFYFHEIEACFQEEEKEFLIFSLKMNMKKEGEEGPLPCMESLKYFSIPFIQESLKEENFFNSKGSNKGKSFLNEKGEAFRGKLEKEIENAFIALLEASVFEEMENSSFLFAYRKFIA